MPLRHVTADDIFHERSTERTSLAVNIMWSSQRYRLVFARLFK